MAFSIFRAGGPGHILTGLAVLALAAFTALPAQAEIKINFSSAAPPSDFLSKSCIFFLQSLNVRLEVFPFNDHLMKPKETLFAHNTVCQEKAQDDAENQYQSTPYHCPLPIY